MGTNRSYHILLGVVTIILMHTSRHYCDAMLNFLITITLFAFFLYGSLILIIQSKSVKEGRPTLEESTQTEGAFKVNVKVPEVTKNK